MAKSDVFEPPALNERLSEILQAVVEDYIATAEPVGSRSLTKRNPGIDLSPATVRNAMSDLEGLGFLSATHASAGRVPTALAFRVYIERLASRGRLAPREKEAIDSLLGLGEGANREMSAVLQDASRVLSSLSHQAALVLLPALDAVVFANIELVQVAERRVLAVFVAKSGIIQQRVIDVDFAISRDELRHISDYLNALLDGKTLAEVRETILREMKSEQVAADALMRHALTLGEQTLLAASKRDDTVLVEGERCFLEHPEFSDVAKMRKLFRAFEEKTLLLRILDAAATRLGNLAGDANKGAVYFGAEGSVRELKDLVAVMAPYASTQGSAGQVGVVGPIRMDYSRVIPLVEYTADALSKSFGVEPSEGPKSGGSGPKNPHGS